MSNSTVFKIFKYLLYIIMNTTSSHRAVWDNKQSNTSANSKYINALTHLQTYLRALHDLHALCTYVPCVPYIPYMLKFISDYSMGFSAKTKLNHNGTIVCRKLTQAWKHMVNDCRKRPNNAFNSCCILIAFLVKHSLYKVKEADKARRTLFLIYTPGTDQYYLKNLC